MKKYNLIVAGGGFSGVCAAIAAARQGLSVLLFDKSNCLGGSAVNCLVLPFMNYYTSIDGEKFSLCQGIFKEIIEELKKFSIDMGENSGELPDQDFYYNEEYLKIVLNRMAISAGVELLFHSYLLSCDTAGGTVNSVKIANKSGICDLTADYFIDATGDANIAALGGFPYRLGREEDGLCQPMTL
jgi:flavin-dependent dehydrogenase